MGAEEDALRLEIEVTRAQLERRVDTLIAQLSPRRVVQRGVEHPLRTGTPALLVGAAAVAALVLPRTRIERAISNGKRKSTVEQLLSLLD